MKRVKDMVAEAETGIDTVSVSEAATLRDDPGVQIVDLRDRRELEREGRIPGALHCPRGMLEFWIDPESPYHHAAFAAPKRFVFYCAMGWRSALGAKTAHDMGLADVAHIGGGFTAWREAGMPVEEVSRKS